MVVGRNLKLRPAKHPRQPWVRGDKEDPCVPESHEVAPRGVAPLAAPPLVGGWMKDEYVRHREP